MFQRVQRQPRMYEEVARQIKAAILTNHQRPGDQLPPERELIERFAVSRSVIRESLKVLAEKGLIEIIPGKGAFVCEPASGAVRDALHLYLRRQRDESFARNLTEVRQLLEGETATLAAERATAEDLKKIEAALARMEAEKDNLENFAQADLQFHQALAAATHNDLMELLLHPVAGVLTDLMMQLSPLPKARDEAIRHHRSILRAVKRRDATQARRAMHEHLGQFERRFREYQAVRQSLPKPE
ncbi:MAG TPA: FadR/GntR family transcriptional regulator [Blastocatellia bacterium]|nr:FadR/GntR family transcriptional regulator [Blastocatellia bacterium]